MAFTEDMWDEKRQKFPKLSVESAPGWPLIATPHTTLNLGSGFCYAHRCPNSFYQRKETAPLRKILTYFPGTVNPGLLLSVYRPDRRQRADLCVRSSRERYCRKWKFQNFKTKTEDNWEDVVQNREFLDKTRACRSRKMVFRRDSRVSWRRNKCGVRSRGQGLLTGQKV